MPQYACRLALPTGEIVERTMEASDEASLRRDLEDKDYMVLELREQSPIFSAVAGMLKLRPSVPAREFLFFNQEFSALIRAGLPILASLDILIERRKNPVFRRALVDIRDRVKGGESLSDAFGAQGDLFPPLYAASLASGERSGELPTVLKRYIVYTRNLMTIKRRVTSAMIYPAILLTMSVALMGLMVFYIIPKFNEFLSDFGAELPLLTRIIIGFTLAAQAHWKLILLVTIGSIAAFTVWRRSPGGQIGFDRLRMRLPLVGGIIRDYAQNRFTRTLATLQSGGIPLVTSLELSARAVGNALLERELMTVATKVREGQSLWESLERTGVISEIAIEMIKVGESTGALVEMLDSASEFSEEEIDYRLSRMITLIEPIMLVVMAVVVAIMLMAIYLPLIEAMGKSKF